MADLRDTIHIDAPAPLVYDLVSDLTRMGEWSPECERVSWRGGATEAVKGAQVIGYNRRGTLRGVTFRQGTAAGEGRHPAFHVFHGPAGVSPREYFILPDAAGPPAGTRGSAAPLAVGRRWPGQMPRPPPQAAPHAQPPPRVCEEAGDR